MAIWNRCAICGQSIPVGELCYGVKNWRGDPIGGDTICRDCLVPENAPALTPQNEWVSVDERLPPPKQNVLAYSPESGIAEADYGDGVWMQYRWSAVMQGVTHWMPLPVPPDSRPSEEEEDT